jgi:hypothetical protein
MITIIRNFRQKKAKSKKKKMKKLQIFFFIVAISLISCGCGAKNGCLLSKPAPIFEADMKGVSGHKFESAGYESSEILELPELAMRLEVLQSGCEEVVQEFRFELDGTVNDVRTASATAQLIADIFGNIRDISPERLHGFMDLAQTLNANYMNFGSFGESVTITTEDNRVLEATVTKVNEPKRTFLTLILRIK